MTAVAGSVARRIWGLTWLFVLAGTRENLRRSRATALPADDRTFGSPPRASVMPRLAVPERKTAISARLLAMATGLGLATLAIVTISSRLRYVLSFDGTYGSGDAHGILVRAFFLREGNFSPSPHLALTHDIFDQPPLLPALLAMVSFVPGVSLEIAPLVLMPAMTLAAVVVLYRLLHRTLGLPIAIGASLMFALLPRWSFDSTEPDKAPAVVSMFVFALAATEAGRRDRRFLLLGGFFMGLSMMAHTTAYFFLPVLVGSHVAWNAGSLRRAVDRFAVGALAFPAAAIVVYFLLARQFAGQSIVDGGVAESGGVLPSFVQTYVDALTNLATGGFNDSAWSLYFNGIRDQLGATVFFFALGGLALAIQQVVFQRRWELAPYVLWAAIVTLAFAVQYPSWSHRSRYPSYVTPVYIVLACNFAWQLGGLALLWRGSIARVAGVCVFAGLAIYAIVTYAAAPNPGLRDLYASHKEAAGYVTGERLLDDGGGALYLGWPSITFSMLESRPEYEHQLFTFGFGSRDLDEFTPAFLEEHNIRYYLYDHTGNDYYGSADTVRDMLVRTMVFEQVATFTGRAGSYTTLYRLHQRATISADARPAMYAAARVSPSRNLELENGDLCPSIGGGLSGWEENGIVSVDSSGREPYGCGVFVTNHKEWGGIRQTVPFGVPGQPFTAIAAVQPLGPNPARTALVAVFAGSTEIGESLAVLDPGVNYLVLQAFTPVSGEAIRLVVSSGPGDDGGIAIDGIAIADGFPGNKQMR